MRMIHFAPEVFFFRLFPDLVRSYMAVDLMDVPGIRARGNLTALPFKNGAFDFVYASHVLEHIRDDVTAVHEIRRILSPGGIAVLPVPIVTPATVEYPAPNPFEGGHVRAPGRDYYDRYRNIFNVVTTYHSSGFPAEFQTFIYEDRASWPTRTMPLRRPMPGDRHEDIVPVCIA